MTESAIEQRLRRFCTKRKSGIAPCGDEILKRWNGDGRTDLISMFKKANLDKAGKCYITVNMHAHITAHLQAELKRQVQILVREETSKTLRVKCGWYTEKAMKETLKMGKFGTKTISFFSSIAFAKILSYVSFWDML